MEIITHVLREEDDTAIYESFVSLSLPPALVDVNRIDHAPAVNSSVGFCDVAPLLKLLHEAPASSDFSHSHDVGVLVLASVKVTLSGEAPMSGVAEKSATGGLTV